MAGNGGNREFTSCTRSSAISRFLARFKKINPSTENAIPHATGISSTRGPDITREGKVVHSIVVLSAEGHTSCSDEDNHSQIRSGDCPLRKPMSKQDRGLVNILFLVTAFFLLFNSPQIMRVGVSYLTPSKALTARDHADKFLAFHLTNNLSNLNLSANFFLYCFSGKKFRRDLGTLFGKVKRICSQLCNNSVDYIG